MRASPTGRCIPLTPNVTPAEGGPRQLEHSHLPHTAPSWQRTRCPSTPSMPALTPQGWDPGTWASLPSRGTRARASWSSLCPPSALTGEDPGAQALSLSTPPQHGDEPGQASARSVPRLAGHRLAARRCMKRLLPEAVSGSGDEPRRRAVEISLASGIICPFTSYVGVRTPRRATWHQGKERHWGERAGGAAPRDVLIPLELEPQPQATPSLTGRVPSPPGASLPCA